MEILTPARVGLLLWAFTAVFMGTVGLASYQFGSHKLDGTSTNFVLAGQRLPASGDVETTASIGQSQRVANVEIMDLQRRSPQTQQTEIKQAQIEVLQLEIAGLKRRLSALAEQNMAYSRRIAALEKDNEALQTAQRETPKYMPGNVASLKPVQTIPQPATVSTPENLAVTNKNRSAEPRPKPSQQATGPTTQIAQVSSGNQTSQTEPRIISLIREQEQKVGAQVNNQRVVELAPAQGEPVVTGSLPPSNSAGFDIAPTALPGSFDPTPSSETLRPRVLGPSEPAGRLRGSGDSQIKRSDFGAVIGSFETVAAATKAWSDFKDQNEERMRDLRPLMVDRTPSGGGVALLIGPFANAADASVACIHLVDVTEICRPMLFAGEPLVTSAEFRDTAF